LDHLVEPLREFVYVESRRTKARTRCGADFQNVPIPGSSNPGRIAENAEAVNIKLTEEDLKGINETLASFEVAGGRYDEHQTAVLVSLRGRCKRHI